MDIKRLKEFAEIDNLDKFKYGSTIMFACGVKTYGWYIRNKDEIFASDNYYAEKIKQDYKKYEQIQKDKKRLEKEKTISLNMSIEKVYQEFIDINDSSKFNYNSSIKLKNGMSTGKWFIQNAHHIFLSKTPSCVKITEQYYKKQKMDEVKRRYISQKRKLEFIECNNIQKYDKFNSPLFKDGTHMSDWFYAEYPVLKKSKKEIDKLIKKGYSDYILLYELRKEFLDAPAAEKFEPLGVARFTTGAVMYLYWECFSEEILTSNNPIDREIARQYMAYSTGDKKEVLIKK